VKIKLGSLFDGIGGFPLAAAMHGITPVWASEIKPFRVAVTKRRFPHMEHLGDITQIDGSAIEPVDIITFGSPCQDLSVAGKRDGLEGARSNLFYEAVRIIREMRRATNGRYPRFIIWENVPGAFSSNKRQDFRAVLEEITEAEIPMPKSGRWARAGMVRGNGCSLAWRVLDAQYWGVPQRRKRIFLVADFAGQSAPEILFECEGVPGDIAESRKAWEEVAASTGASVESTKYDWGTGDRIGGWIEREDRIFAYQSDKKRSTVQEHIYHKECGKADSLTHQKQNVICLNDQGGESIGIENNLSPTLRAEAHGNLPCVAVAFAYNQRNEVRDMKDKPGALQAQPGMNQQTFVLQGSMIGRQDHNGPQGDGINEDISFTLNTTDRHAVAAVVQLVVKPSVCTVVRRLTPLECERLQGFPDGWTDIPGASDSARYRALGDSVAVPCVAWIMGRIKSVLVNGK